MLYSPSYNARFPVKYCHILFYVVCSVTNESVGGTAAPPPLWLRDTEFFISSLLRII